MRTLLATLTLLIWGACSLHCSVEAHKMWAGGDKEGTCSSSSSCPEAPSPDECPDTHCQDALYTFSGKTIQLDIPVSLDTDADPLHRLIGLLNENFERSAFACDQTFSRSGASLIHDLRDQSSGRIAAPIRGPSV